MFDGKGMPYVHDRERRTTVHGVPIIIREGKNEFGATLIEYYADAAGTRPLAIVQGLCWNDPCDPLDQRGYVVEGFTLDRQDGYGLWIFDPNDGDGAGMQLLALACQQAIDSIRELLPDIAR